MDGQHIHAGSRQFVRYLRNIDQVAQLSAEEKERLKTVTAKYSFRANTYYLDLIDWSDPDDPLRRLVVPSLDELEEWGRLDASGEKNYTVAPGTQHKYPHTALILCTEMCASFCRYCFRKRLFMQDNREVAKSIEASIRYIESTPAVNNVLLTGGDPLILSTPKLEKIIARLRKIDHVKVIRIGTKVPAFNPYRIIDDPALLEMVRRYSLPDRRIYIMTHFAHPNELSGVAREGIRRLIDAGAMLANQCPLLAGINDDPEVLGTLFNELASTGATPYYLFQNRPTTGNAPFRVPISRGSEIFQQALGRVSGLGRRIRYTMSHMTGKIEIVGVDERHIYLRYHRAAERENDGRFLVCKRNDEAYWFDDLELADPDEGRVTLTDELKAVHPAAKSGTNGHNGHNGHRSR